MEAQLRPMADVLKATPAIPAGLVPATDLSIEAFRAQPIAVHGPARVIPSPDFEGAYDVYVGHTGRIVSGTLVATLREQPSAELLALLVDAFAAGVRRGVRVTKGKMLAVLSGVVAETAKRTASAVDEEVM